MRHLKVYHNRDTLIIQVILKENLLGIISDSRFKVDYEYRYVDLGVSFWMYCKTNKYKNFHYHRSQALDY